MCGFIGIISEQTAYHKTLRDQAVTIKDRGVELAYKHSEHESYAYARLPTDGISTETLGDFTADTRRTFLFNGLITNTDELVARFQLSLTESSDYYALKEGLEKYDIDFLEACEGMFAGASITPAEITLFRDAIGVKPLYYVISDNMCAFASEIKALQSFGLPVHEVAPGTAVYISRADFGVHIYHFSYRQQSTASLRELLRNAVVAPTKRYLAQSTRDIAILLSGGVDSSIIAQLLANHLNSAEKQRIHAFCTGSETANDVRTAKKLAKHLGFKLTHVPHYTDLEALEAVTSVVYKSESPHARVAKVALLYDKLAKEIQRRDIHIVIGGEGADELFYGYHRFIDGLTDMQTERCFKEFYVKVFPVTLLQRFDRIFAHHQIEGRVPYLNQAVIAYAHNLPTERKVRRLEAGHISKLPLRQLAKEIGLPQYIYDREKEKMTAGATGQANESQSHGFLEASCQSAKQTTFGEFIQNCHQSLFQSPLRQPYASSEESIMYYVQRCKIINQEGRIS